MAGEGEVCWGRLRACSGLTVSPGEALPSFARLRSPRESARNCTFVIFRRAEGSAAGAGELPSASRAPLRASTWLEPVDFVAYRVRTSHGILCATRKRASWETTDGNDCSSKSGKSARFLRRRYRPCSALPNDLVKRGEHFLRALRRFGGRGAGDALGELFSRPTPRAPKLSLHDANQFALGTVRAGRNGSERQTLVRK